MTTRNNSAALAKERSGCDAGWPGRPGGDAMAAAAKRPFDTTELRRVPRPREDDPPYRSWWVIDSQASDDAP